MSEDPKQDDEQSGEKLLTPQTGNENSGNGKDPENPESKPVEEREQWTDPVQFFMTFLGYCVGLGNIWRFPYLCQQNGGGAFVVPFLIMMVLEGMPLLLLELGIGQKLRQGSLGVWNSIHPCFGGIGLGSTVVACIVGCYYNMIIAWCFYYLFMSIRLTLPWSECPTEIIDELSNVTVVVPECQMSSETQYFWYRSALDITGEIGDFGGIRWWMLLCLIFAWIITFLIIMKGIQTSGKVVYFTALFPYVVMTIFFIRGLTLKGAGAGLAHMFLPKLDSLLKPTVWLDAATQVFYSYGLGMGTLISFGSYNNYNTNVVRDVYIFSACNAFTCVYACAVVFTILGFKAQTLFDRCLHEDIETILTKTSIWAGKNLENITESDYYHLVTSGTELPSIKNCSLEVELNQAAQGTGLAFQVMADVFTMLPGSPFWSLLFFSMLLSLGIGSQIGIMEGMIGTLFDTPQLKHIKKPILTGCCCLFCFLVGVLFTTGAGEYWLTLVDTYGATGLTLIAFIEVIIIMYVYGHKRFTEDIKDMTGVELSIYWQITWRFVAPVLIFVILMSSIIFQITNSTSYNTWNQETAASEKKEYPPWALFLAALLTLASTIPMIIVAAIKGWGIWKSRSNGDQAPKATEVPLMDLQADKGEATKA